MILGDGLNQAADWARETTSTASRNVASLITLGNGVGAFVGFTWKGRGAVKARMCEYRCSRARVAVPRRLEIAYFWLT